MASAEQIDKAYSAQVQNKFKLKNTSVGYRISKLEQVKKSILKYQNEIEVALSNDFGKAPSETCLTEILPVITMINDGKKYLKKWSRPRKVKSSLLFFGTKSYIEFESKGNVLIISPWNYPFQLTMYPILTAFMAGNTVIAKPSEYTPGTNNMLRKILAEAFSEQEVCLLEGEAETTQSLLAKPFDHVFFTGSTPVGKIIMEKASKNLSSVSLELGGKSPAIIFDDFDFEKAVKRVVWGKLVNAGQTCVAPDYVIIDKKRREDFVREFKKHVESLYGNSYNENPDYCRIITPRHANRLRSIIEDALDKGAKLEHGGHLFENNKLEPTLLTGVGADMKVMEEEIFGPVLPVIEVESHSEIVTLIKKMDNPLSMYVFSKNKEVIDYIKSETSSGSFAVNEVLLHVAHSQLPFGGAGKSGHGRYHGRAGFEEFSNHRAVFKRNFDTIMDYFYPPYSEKMKGIIDFLIGKLNQFL